MEGRRERGPGEPDITEGERVWERQQNGEKSLANRLENVSNCLRLCVEVSLSNGLMNSANGEFGEPT